MTVYLLDSDVFIQAKNLHYGFEIVPAFWRWLEQGHGDGILFTVEECANEVVGGNDELAQWMKDRPKSFKLSPKQSDQASMQATSAWAAAQPQYSQGAKATFSSNGDFFLVAQAHSLGYTVVTHEGTHPYSKNRIMVPDACKGMSVSCMSPFDMLKAEHVKFTEFTTN